MVGEGSYLIPGLRYCLAGAAGGDLVPSAYEPVPRHVDHSILRLSIFHQPNPLPLLIDHGGYV